MLFTTILALVGLAGSAVAAPAPARQPPVPTSYLCVTNLGSFRITRAAAVAATTATFAGSGFPHGFGGLSGNTNVGDGHGGSVASGGNTQLKFFGGANQICNEPPADPANPPLAEYPVMRDGSVYKGRINGHTLTPARAIYIKATGEVCGVVTHFVEDATHFGSGPFRVCDAN